MVKFVLHFLFLGAGVAYLVAALSRVLLEGGGCADRRARRERRLRVLQLLAARAGTNLDHGLLSPVTAERARIDVYGAIGGTPIYGPTR